MGGQAYITDVRGRDEFEMGHLVGAVSIPLGELRRRLPEVPHDRPVYLHCRTSWRSYNIIIALKGRGYDSIINISGFFLGIGCCEYPTDMATGREKILAEYNFVQTPRGMDAKLQIRNCGLVPFYGVGKGVQSQKGKK